MSLKTYKKKRDFSKTSEPDQRGKKSTQTEHELEFVVQEHHASHLHWDFRLELDGVLKSWAVPKGPPEKAKEKRLAVQVEDHPLDYAKFEGSIPEGQYGGGDVYIWDKGTWAPEKKSPRTALKNGQLEFTLYGDRLKGSYVLVRTKNAKNWLLLKRSHDHATAEHPHSKPTSSVSRSPKTKGAKQTEAKSKSVKRQKSSDIELSPMLATLVEETPQGAGWLHEIKYDGYRILSRIDDGKSELFTRNGLNWTAKFAKIAKALSQLKLTDAVFDGEIVGIDERGRSDFHTLQTALKEGETDQLLYYVFDVLALNGEDLRDLPLTERKARLQKVLLKAKSPIALSEYWTSHAKKLFAQSCELGLEGVLSKRADSVYSPGRGNNWVKSKCVQNEEFVIVGFTKSEKIKDGFGALLLAARNEKSDFVYVGRVGTGFDQRTMRDLKSKFKKLQQKSSPLDSTVPNAKTVQWLKPVLIAQVQFAEWTHDKILRHASFQGLREDKAAKDVKIDEPVPLKKAGSKKSEFVVTHPDRIIFPETDITKQDLADYYSALAPEILKAIQDRPLSLMRCPQGAGEKCFFQKHLPNESTLLIQNKDDLLQLIQLGTIELHAWNCHGRNSKYGDQVVFDLDPAEDVPWKKVIDCAKKLKVMLDQLKLVSFLKVTGGKGLHIHVPVAPVYTFDQLKAFSKAICMKLEKTHPDLYTTNTSKAKRPGKILLDYLRNGEGATAVAPYSVRARDGAPVALPISWKELTTKIKPDEFKLPIVLKLTRKRDPWADWEKVEKQKISILKADRRGET